MASGDVNPHSFERTPQDSKGQPWTVDYFGGFSLAMRSPNWLPNAFLCGLIAIVPILGPMVAYGFAFENAELLHRSNGASQRDFTFDRFTQYLTRGVGPFLIQFLVGMVCSLPLGLLAVFLVFGSLMAAQGDPEALLRASVTHLMLQPLQIVTNTIVLMVCLPFMTRGGLSAEIGQSFDFGWGFETLKRTLVPCFVMALIWNLAAAVLGAIGVCLCCIGLIPVLGVMYQVVGWYGYQLYRLALAQGMPPVPLKPVGP